MNADQSSRSHSIEISQEQWLKSSVVKSKKQIKLDHSEAEPCPTLPSQAFLYFCSPVLPLQSLGKDAQSGSCTRASRTTRGKRLGSNRIFDKKQESREKKQFASSPVAPLHSPGRDVTQSSSVIWIKEDSLFVQKAKTESWSEERYSGGHKYNVKLLAVFSKILKGEDIGVLKKPWIGKCVVEWQTCWGHC